MQKSLELVGWNADTERVKPNRGVQLAAAYVVARLVIVLTMAPTWFPDTPGYEAVSLLGGAQRPWLVPVLFAVTTDWMFVLLQTVVSAAAFAVLALTVRSTVRNARIGAALAAVVLVVGLSPRVTMWDAVLSSESLAFSLTALIVVVLARFQRTPDAAVLAMFVAWVFVRDAHVYLGVMVAPALAVMAWRQRRQVVVIGVAATMLWGVLASQNNRYIESYNVTANSTFHILSNPERTAWMVDHGMPNVDAIWIADPFARQVALRDDPVWQAWAEDDGVTTYARFLLAHPDHLFEAVPAIVSDVGFQPESMVDGTFAPQTSPTAGPLGVLWPDEASGYVLALLCVALIGMLSVVLRRGWDSRMTLPALLALSTVPHAFLVYHGAPLDLARHGFVLASMLIVSLWWLVALSVEAIVVEDSDDSHGVAIERLMDRQQVVLVGGAIEQDD